jgi:hypothetical protein
MSEKTEMVKAPTPAQIDALIGEYAEAQQAAIAMKTAQQVAQEAADRIKVRLVEWVETFGRKHTEKSKRLDGIHNKATTTTAVTTTTDPQAIDTLHQYLEKQELVELEGALFQKHVTYTLVASPREVLAKVSLAGRIRAKLTALVDHCFRTTTKAPSLKIEVAEISTPAKSKAA